MNFNYPALNILVEKAAGIDDLRWGMASLAEHANSRHLSDEWKKTVAAQSISCGREWAEQIRGQYPVQSPAEILKQWKIPVVLQQYKDPEKSKLIQFAQYKGGSVYVSNNMVATIRRQTQMWNLEAYLGNFDPFFILASHELFHHVEAHNPEIITRTMKIPGCGMLRKSGCPYMASEIGAFAFAKELSGISFYPRILEVIGIYDKLPERAEQIVEEAFLQNTEGTEKRR